MLADEALIDNAFEAYGRASGRMSISEKEAARERMMDLVDQYKMACKLSRGPDWRRSAAWQVTAEWAESKLRGIAGGVARNRCCVGWE